MLVDYEVTEVGCFDNYSDAAPRAETMWGNGISKFILNVSQCITFCQTNIFTRPLIAKASLKSFDSRLGFKIIKDFATSPNFEEARKRFDYESGKYKALQKQLIGLPCHQTIPQRVTVLHYNWIGFNKNINVFKYLNSVPPSDD